MALDLQSEEEMRGEIPRRYRHDAESFASSLIYPCLTTVADKDGKNLTKNPNPLHYWFTNLQGSHSARLALQ